MLLFAILQLTTDFLIDLDNRDLARVKAYKWDIEHQSVKLLKAQWDVYSTRPVGLIDQFSGGMNNQCSVMFMFTVKLLCEEEHSIFLCYFIYYYKVPSGATFNQFLYCATGSSLGVTWVIWASKYFFWHSSVCMFKNYKMSSRRSSIHFWLGRRWQVGNRMLCVDSVWVNGTTS